MIYINIIRELLIIETFLFWENKNENKEKRYMIWIASLVN
jgi:hypothetical protein